MNPTSRRSLSPLSRESDNNISLYADAGSDFLIVDPLSNTECHDSLTSSSKLLSWNHLWEAYRRFVQRNQIILHLADDAVTRILFWMPHDVVVAPSNDTTTTNRRRWREVCFGLLSLHRMIMDLALQNVIHNSYGTTLSIDHGEQPTIPATTIRLCLTIGHDLMPTLMELFNSHPHNNHSNWKTSQHRQAKLRLQLERLKFVLRLTLAVAYWRQLWNKQRVLQQQQRLLAGLLQDGSMFYPDESSRDHSPTLMQEHAYARRQTYSGRRTGRRVLVSQHPPSPQPATNESDPPFPSLDMARLVVGEVWNMYRPLCWAQVEAHHLIVPNKSRMILWWLLSMVMDGVSLKCLQRFTLTNNPATKAEWNRRRMKLFLYVLRSPFWDNVTYPGAQRLAAHILQRIPLLGRILEAYLWDWIYYWKHPWASERD